MRTEHVVSLNSDEREAFKNALKCKVSEKDDLQHASYFVHVMDGTIETRNPSSVSISSIKLRNEATGETLPDGYYRILFITSDNGSDVIFSRVLDDELDLYGKSNNYKTILKRREPPTYEIIIDKEVLINTLTFAGNKLRFSFWGYSEAFEVKSRIGEVCIRNIIEPEVFRPWSDEIEGPSVKETWEKLIPKV